MENVNVDQNGTLQAIMEPSKAQVLPSAQSLPPPMKTQRRRAPVDVVHRPITRSMTRAARMQVVPLTHQPVPPTLDTVPKYNATIYPFTAAHGAHRRRRTLLKPRNLGPGVVRPRKPHWCQCRAKSTRRRKRNTRKKSQRTSMFQDTSLHTPSPTYASPVSPARHNVSHAHTSSYRQHQGQMYQYASPVSPSPHSVSRAHTSLRRQHQGHTSPHEYVSPASGAPHHISHANTSLYKQQQGQASPRQYAYSVSPAPHQISQMHASPSPHASPQRQHQGLSPHRVRGGQISPYTQHQGQGSSQQYKSPAAHHASHMYTSPHHGKATPNLQHPGCTSPQQKHGSRSSPQENNANASPYEVFCTEQERKAFVQSILPSRSPASPQSSHKKQSLHEHSPTSHGRGSEHARISRNDSDPSPKSTATSHIRATKSGKRTQSVTLNELEQQASKVMRITHQEQSSDVKGAIAGSSPLHASQMQQASRSASSARSASPPKTPVGMQQQAPYLQQHLPRVQQMPAQASHAPSSYGSRTQLPSHYMHSAQQASRQPQHRAASYSDQTFYGQASSLASSIIPGLNNTSPPHHMQKAHQTGSPNNINHGLAQSIPVSPQYMQQLQALQASMAQRQRVVQQPQQPMNAREFGNVQQQAPSFNSFTSGPAPSYPSSQSGASGVSGHTTHNHPNGNGGYNSTPISPRGQQSSPVAHPATSATPQSSLHVPTTSSPSPSRRNSGQTNMINADGTSQSNQNNHGPPSRQTSNSSLSTQQPSTFSDDRYYETPGLQYMHT